jgi:hypothetical protein
MDMLKSFGMMAALLLGMGTAAVWAQTEDEVWPKGVNGPRVWPHEIPNNFSFAPNWTYPEGGEPPPTDLFTRAKCPTGTAKVKPKSVNSAKWETSRHHPPEYAFDEYTMTRWSSWDKNAKWIAADLGSSMHVKRVYLVWETAYGKDYDIQVSADSVTWTTAKEVRGGNGQADVVDLDGTGKYIQMMGVAGGSSYGYSLYEFTVCAEGASTAIRRGVVAAGAKPWGLVLGREGLPQGVRAFDLSGKNLSPARKLPAANIYVIP